MKIVTGYLILSGLLMVWFGLSTSTRSLSSELYWLEKDMPGVLAVYGQADFSKRQEFENRYRRVVDGTEALLSRASMMAALFVALGGAHVLTGIVLFLQRRKLSPS